MSIKAISLLEPWASLMANNVKWIETRGWRPRNIKFPCPLAIAASKRLPPAGSYPGEIIRDGTGQLTYLLPEPFTEEQAVARGLPADGDLHGFPIHPGHVVATCTLDWVAPIGGPTSFRTGIFQGDEGDFPGQPVIVRHHDYEWAGADFRLVLDHGRVEDITDQLPYGDWSPGRWGWGCSSIEYLPEPVPARGSLSLWDWDPT